MERRLCRTTPSPLRGGDPLPPLLSIPQARPPTAPVKRNRQERSNGKYSTTSSLQDESACDCRGKEPWEQLSWPRRRCYPHGHRAEHTGCHGGRT